MFRVSKPTSAINRVSPGPRLTVTTRTPYDRLSQVQSQPRDVNRSRRNKCFICSSELNDVHHCHFSALYYMKTIGVNTGSVRDTGGKLFCPSCKSMHGAYPEERIKIIVADSTFHLFFAVGGTLGDSFKGDIIHVNYLTIAGAMSDQLFDAFKIEYGNKPMSRPLDVLFVWSSILIYKSL